MDTTQLIHINEAGQLLGYADTSTLRRWCISGKIEGAQKCGSTWFLPREWVHEQKRKTPKATRGKGEVGRPRGPRQK